MPTIADSDVTFINEDQYNQHINMGQGMVEFMFRLPHLDSVEYTSFTLENYVDGSGLNLSIWHEVDQQWVAINHSTTFDAEYIDNNTVRVRYMNQNEHHGSYFQYPRISVEGVVLDD